MSFPDWLNEQGRRLFGPGGAVPSVEMPMPVVSYRHPYEVPGTARPTGSDGKFVRVNQILTVVSPGSGGTLANNPAWQLLPTWWYDKVRLTIWSPGGAAASQFVLFGRFENILSSDRAIPAAGVHNEMLFPDLVVPSVTQGVASADFEVPYSNLPLLLWLINNTAAGSIDLNVTCDFLITRG